MPSLRISLNPKPFNCVNRWLLVTDEKCSHKQIVFESEGICEHFLPDLYPVHSYHSCTSIIVYYRVPERHTVFSLPRSLAA